MRKMAKWAFDDVLNGSMGGAPEYAPGSAPKGVP